MLRAFLVSVSILFTLIGFSQPEDFDFFNLKGNIKEVTQTYYQVNSNDTILNQKYISKFDNDIEIERLYYDAYKFKTILQKEYDSENRVIEERFYNPGGFIKLERIVSDNHIVNENVHLDFSQSYSYDSDSTKRVVFKSFYKSGVPKSCDTSYYDFLDNYIGRTKENFKDNYFYDGKGQLIKQKMMVNENSSREVHYKYNETGQLTTNLSYFTRIQTKKERLLTYKYNKHNNLIESKMIDYFHKVTITRKYNYIYDVNTNWIKRTTYRNNEIEKIAEREITYSE